MLKIRLQRIGRKNDPSFRVVVTEHTRGPKSEKHVDRVGFYNPKTKEQKLDEVRIKHWIENGAQASGTVHNMLIKAGIIKADTINVLPQKSPVVKEQAEEEKKEEAAPAEEGAQAPAEDTAEAAPEEANPPAGGEEAETPVEEEASAEEEKKEEA
ncbi:MAG: 30S ribosomal protein S16 [Parcubacteria group bacterium]|jgi:small subunit ribosomal protein S16|nr:30S ribosomal protein S16 [Parcubacteria group bacterium]|tara:strand:+ start:1726 stop:2190 length:465 start_codon:yes stop_codon:yes gene_type:complete